MKAGFRVSFILLLMLAGSMPAHANNPPAPDGMLSVVMIFPVAILGLRWAGAKFSEKHRKWRLLRGFGLGLATLLTMGGTEIALIPLLILLVYGLLRGGQIMKLGQGGKRFAIGAAVMLFTLFAVVNYLASLNYRPSVVGTEADGARAMRMINWAEQQFQSAGRLDANKNGVGEYGTLSQLRHAGFLDDGSVSPASRRAGYQLVLVLSGDPQRDEKEYFLYASPTTYGEPPWTLSALGTLRPRRVFARRTFATDETGVIRSLDLGSSRPVTRQEARKWEPL